MEEGRIETSATTKTRLCTNELTKDKDKNNPPEKTLFIIPVTSIK
jgi:hypothetical protein